MHTDPYRRLAERLNAIPNGFPPTEDGVELHLLAALFTPEEAELAADMRLTVETVEEIASRRKAEPAEVRVMLKSMTRRGLIAAGHGASGLGYRLMPFVVGIYEMQAGRLDAELARLFEAYYHQAFGRTLEIQPAVHRVIPVDESLRLGIEIRPYESAEEIVQTARAWGVVDCICRTQKALIGDPCDHPVDVCLVLSQRPNAFDHSPTVHPLDRSGAISRLKLAADAGLVHSVSNNQRGVWYICNCCTCSCGILRGMAELGIANVVARSAFVNQVDEDLCNVCAICLDSCQFDALSLDLTAEVDVRRCVGCGVCVIACPENALGLIRRGEAELHPTPESEADWMALRAQTRGIDIREIL